MEICSNLGPHTERSSSAIKNCTDWWYCHPTTTWCLAIHFLCIPSFNQYKLPLNDWREVWVLPSLDLSSSSYSSSFGIIIPNGWRPTEIKWVRFKNTVTIWMIRTIIGGGCWLMLGRFQNFRFRFGPWEMIRSRFWSISKNWTFFDFDSNRFYLKSFFQFRFWRVRFSILAYKHGLQLNYLWLLYLYPPFVKK